MSATTESVIESVTLVVGLEVHVELAAKRKMFAGAPSPAHKDAGSPEPNTLIDPVVYALPGALPVMNRAAVEMSMMVGLALNCSIARTTKWDRKSYFYPDLPKGYQISQYDLPLCFDGAVDLPATDPQGFPDFEREPRRIGIIRAHLEEDAGKLLHEAPGGHAIPHSLVDENRAGTALLEIVTQPDFRSAEEVVLFAKTLRNICRFLGVTEGVMQKGHMRFEPNINCHLAMSDGTLVKTPIVEIKNLNSFKALKGAIEFEAADQPRRWTQDRRVMGKGTKITRGWDDGRNCTVVQREKEDAHDYRYFPDPDLPPVVVSEEWRESVRARLPELPPARLKSYMRDFALGVKEATVLSEERDVCLFYEEILGAMVEMGVERARAGKLAANFVLGVGQRLANERGVLACDLGIAAPHAAGVARLREDGKLSNQGAEELFEALCHAPLLGTHAESEEAGTPNAALVYVESLAKEKGLLIVRDDAAMEKWIEQVLTANPKVVEEVRGGKAQAAGRLIGEVMKLAGGKADAKTVREMILKKIQG